MSSHSRKPGVVTEQSESRVLALNFLPPDGPPLGFLVGRHLKVRTEEKETLYAKILITSVFIEGKKYASF